MIRPVTRNEVFSRSRLADYYISNAQTPYQDPETVNEEIDCEKSILDDSQANDDYTDEEGNKLSWYEKGSLMKDLNDHQEPFHDGESLTNDFAVLGYSRKNAGEYLKSRSKALIRFFEIMKISQLYLLDELRYDWLRFPFRSSEKLAVIKSLVHAPSYREAFEMDIGELAVILPLFNYSGRSSMPIIMLISTNDEVPIAMFLCDDGNFHTSFHADDREKMFYAASAAGLVMGGVEVCTQMY
ncbi:MAG: hypothetical protein ABI151_13530 [Chitinophagaceae bacterium]